jgi:transposase-like protein
VIGLFFILLQGGYSIMARKVNQALREQWRRRIERQRGSGLSVLEFCRSEGVSPACFHLWKRKLRESSSPSPHPSAGPRRTMPQPSPVCADGATGVTGFLQLPVIGPRTSPWIELVLVDGTIVRVPQQNLAALQTVLRALRDGHAPMGSRGMSYA